ncbi:MAG: acetyl-CoA hydrolase/transferase family protein [Bacteroidetes bacterium]|nr:acetyl-CoA hydrolase/transferase family protein [Bacteroidota bacterium]
MNSRFRYKSAEEALQIIQSGNRVFIQGNAATPIYLLNKLAERTNELLDVELVMLGVFGDIELTKPEYSKSFRINSLFISEVVRRAVNENRADYIPVFLSEIPELFKWNILPLDVAIVHVSSPDKHGFCSLGVSVDIARSAVDSAKHVIAQVNPQMPRTHGDGMMHISSFDSLVLVDEALPEVNYGFKTSETEMKIGAYIADLIEDGSTLQMGIGSIPDAVLQSLGNHKNLGVHTEMFSDGIIPLIENGVINNKLKKKHPGKVVAGFCLGSRKLYDYVDDNPMFAFLDIDYVNDVSVIKRNPKVVAINSAIEIDITGQVCSDSIGTYQFSGVGGQMDFMRGATLSEKGKPMLALPSRTGKGIPRIVSFLNQGAGVVTTRANVHYVVTEFGVAYLFGKNLRQRAKALISIAHPDDRENLEKNCFERFGV